MPKKKYGLVTELTEKTATVVLKRSAIHPLYKKIIIKTKKYLVHRNEKDLKIGQGVHFIDCKPISKKIKWKIDC